MKHKTYLLDSNVPFSKSPRHVAAIFGDDTPPSDLIDLFQPGDTIWHIPNVGWMIREKRHSYLGRTGLLFLEPAVDGMEPFVTGTWVYFFHPEPTEDQPPRYDLLRAYTNPTPSTAKQWCYFDTNGALVPPPKRSEEDLSALIDGWKKDPNWDLECSEGFEAHYEQLKAISDAHIKERQTQFLKEIGHDLLHFIEKHHLGDGLEDAQAELFELTIQQLKKNPHDYKHILTAFFPMPTPENILLALFSLHNQIDNLRGRIIELEQR